MKKTILFLTIGLLIFASSCKKDEDDTNNGGGTTPVVKKWLISKITNNDNSYTEISYNANKLVSTVKNYKTDGSLNDGLNVEYSSNKLSKISIFDGNEDIGAYFNYIYSNNKLDKMIYLADTDNDNQIDDTVAVYDYFINTNLDSLNLYYGAVLYKKAKYTWNSGNISNAKHYVSGISGFDLDKIYDYEYDTKINTKHGIGLDYFLPEIDDVSIMVKNNLTKITKKDENGVINIHSSRNYINKYNDEDRIINSITISLAGDTLGVETYLYTQQ